MVAVTDLVENIVSLMEIMVEGAWELLNQFRSGDIAACQVILNDLGTALDRLSPVYESIGTDMSKSSYLSMAENLSFTLDQVVENMNGNRDERVFTLIEFQLIPFLEEWKEDTYFWSSIYPDKKRLDDYYQNEFVRNHRNRYVDSGKLKYQISIFIPVYNKVEYTKKCIQSIYENTDFTAYSYELILLNDGSTDGTQVYFESLGVNKVIQLHNNVRTMIFLLAYRVCEGQYAIFVNNDTIVTNGWIDSLLSCIRSDQRIISATPATPNTSNYQSEKLEDMTETNVQQFAKDYNQLNSLRWGERARIMPVIAMYDMQKVNQIGFADRLFHTMEFWDDDFSLRARRHGFKQMLCKDVCCFHFGSVTGRALQVTEQSFYQGRKSFEFKHGIDAWGHGFYYNLQAMELVSGTLHIHQSKVNILGIDCGFGDTLLQLKNYLKTQGIQAVLYNITDEAVFEQDLSAQSDWFRKIGTIETIACHLPDINFDYVYISHNLEHYSDYMKLLYDLIPHVSIGGCILCSVTNPYPMFAMERIPAGDIFGSKDSVIGINTAYLEDYFKRLNFDIKRTDSCVTVLELERSWRSLCMKFPQLKTLPRMDLRKYQFQCIKQKEQHYE